LNVTSHERRASYAALAARPPLAVFGHSGPPVRRGRSAGAAAGPTPAARHRLLLEPLEERTVLSTVPYVVASLADSGAGTLRAAITTADGDTSNFYLIELAVTGSINLQSALPDLTNHMTIQGPGAGSLTVQRDVNTSFRIFTNDAFPDINTVNISGLTIANGCGDGNGGGIDNLGNLTIASCTLTQNSADGSGGAIANAGPGGVDSDELHIYR